MKKSLLVYAAVKDLSIWVLYFIILKFDMTNETYTAGMKHNFPGASDMAIPSMLFVALFITWLPMLADAVVLIILNKLVGLRYTKWIWSLGIGIVLHLPIVVFWKVMEISKGYAPNLASSVSLLLSFLVAGVMMVAVHEKPRRVAI